jgi:hypothetical protein
MPTKNKTVNVIKFPATVAQVKTLVDGGIRVTFDWTKIQFGKSRHCSNASAK